MFTSPYFVPVWFASPFWRPTADPPVPPTETPPQIVSLPPRELAWRLPLRSVSFHLPARDSLWRLSRR